MALVVSHTRTHTQSRAEHRPNGVGLDLHSRAGSFIPSSQQPAFTFDQDLKWQRRLGWHVRQLPIRSAHPQATGIQPSSYPATLPMHTISTPGEGRSGGGRGGGGPLPTPITEAAAGDSRFVQNFLRININHCQVVFNASGQPSPPPPASTRWVTFQLSNAHKLFHWAKFPPGWTGSMYCTHPNAVTSK